MAAGTVKAKSRRRPSVDDELSWAMRSGATVPGHDVSRPDPRPRTGWPHQQRPSLWPSLEDALAYEASGWLQLQQLVQRQWLWQHQHGLCCRYWASGPPQMDTPPTCVSQPRMPARIAATASSSPAAAAAEDATAAAAASFWFGLRRYCGCFGGRTPSAKCQCPCLGKHFAGYGRRQVAIFRGCAALLAGLPHSHGPLRCQIRLQIKHAPGYKSLVRRFAWSLLSAR